MKMIFFHMMVDEYLWFQNWNPEQTIKAFLFTKMIPSAGKIMLTHLSCCHTTKARSRSYENNQSTNNAGCCREKFVFFRTLCLFMHLMVPSSLPSSVCMKSCPIHQTHQTWLWKSELLSCGKDDVMTICYSSIPTIIMIIPFSRRYRNWSKCWEEKTPNANGWYNFEGK